MSILILSILILSILLLSIFLLSIFLLSIYFRVCGVTVKTFAQHWEVLGSILNPKRVIAKNVKICTYCCYVRCATLIVWVGENALAPNRRNSVTCKVRTSRLLSTVPWGIFYNSCWLCCLIQIIMFYPILNVGEKWKTILEAEELIKQRWQLLILALDWLR